MNKAKNFRKTSLLKFSLAIFFCYLLYVKVDFSALQQSWRNLDFIYLYLAFCVTILAFLCEVVRLKFLYDPYSQSLLKLAKLKLAAATLNNLLPSSLSGEIYVAFKHGKDIALKLIGRNLIMTIINFAVMMILVLISFYLLELIEYIYYYLLHLLRLDYIFAVVGLVIISMFFLSKNKKSRKIIDSIFALVFEIKGKNYLYIFLFALIVILFRIYKFQLLLMAQEVNLDYPSLMILIFILSVASILPLIFGGIGVLEASIVGVMVFLGVSFEQALVAAIINRIFMIILSIAGTYFLLLERKLS